MQIQIRLAQSGHSYIYEQVRSIQQLMQKILNQLKIQIQDQLILTKSGQNVKHLNSVNFLQQIMKKTIPTSQTSQKQIQCLYIYNKKQLSKSQCQKIQSQQYYLQILEEKSNEMSILQEKSFQFGEYSKRIQQMGINHLLDIVNKRVRIPIQDLISRYQSFLESANRKNYLRIRISSLLDLIQNQQKARKLLIRNLQIKFQNITKKKFQILKDKIKVQNLTEDNQINLKQNSGFFNNSKSQSSFTNDINHSKQIIQKKIDKFYQRLRQQKKLVVKKKFVDEQKTIFQIYHESIKNQQESQQYIMLIKSEYYQICNQIIKISKIKQTKDTFKNLLSINEKIISYEAKIQQNINRFVDMYVKLCKIHTQGQRQAIRFVFNLHIQLVNNLNQIDTDMKGFEKDLYLMKNSGYIQVSQFLDNKYVKPSSKKNLLIHSPSNKSILSKQGQGFIPQMYSPSKNKICKQSLKDMNDNQNNQANQNNKTNENKQLTRRLQFNRRLEGLMKYCSKICQNQQQSRRNFRSSKDYQCNKIQLLLSLSVPNIQIDYSQSSDLELSQLYSKQPLLPYQQFFQSQLIHSINNIHYTLTSYLAGKSNLTQKQRNLERILGMVSEVFYKMMNNKMQKEKQTITIQYDSKLQQQMQLNQMLMIKLAKINEEYQLDDIFSTGKAINHVSKLNENFNKLNDNPCKVNENFNKVNDNASKVNDNANKIKDKQSKIKKLLQINQVLSDQNTSLNIQIQQLNQKLLSYQQQMDIISHKLSQIQLSNTAQIQSLKLQLERQHETNSSIVVQNKQSTKQIDTLKKNLLKQVETNQMLYKEILQFANQRQFYQAQFTQLKNLLADREVQIIKLENQIKIHQDYQIKQSIKEQSLNQAQGEMFQTVRGSCKCAPQIQELKLAKQQLQTQIEMLESELDKILRKQTQQQEIQTQIQDSSRNNQNQGLNDYQQNKLRAEQIINQVATKPIGLQNKWHPQSAVSHYYMNQANSWQSTLSKLIPISIGSTLQQGHYHIFLPFSQSLYIGISFLQDTKSFTSYEQYCTDRLESQLIYILDLDSFAIKTRDMLKECSLVLLVRVEHMQSQGKQVMVKGRIQFAMGFQDQDMQPKNYAHFLS